MNLRLLQLADSALPIGGYTYSWGLEAALARRVVHDIESLERWARCWLRHSAGPLEGVVVAAVCRAANEGDWQTAWQANTLLEATLVVPSIRQGSLVMGEQLLGLGSVWCWSAAGISRFTAMVPEGNDWRRWHHAVVFGLLGSLAGCTAQETLTGYLHQGVLGMIGAGVRAIPVSHTHGQQLLAYLQDDIVRLVEELALRSLDTAGSGSPFHEVLCDEQTRLYSRMFRS